VDVLFGGGAAFFTPKSAEGGQRDDERNLLEEMSRDMRVVRTAEEFEAMPRAERVAGLFHPEHPPAAAERAPDLAALTEKAIEVLSQAPTGYFLMVEGSQIDWAGHGNDAGGIIAETLDFDDAVGVGLDAAQVDGDTLVVITSDHETGGFAIHNGDRHAKKVDETGFTSGGHTATMVPIFAYGPGAGAFGGVLDNTKVGRLLIDFVTRR
jgi:alkaline phosphatase